MSIKNIMLTFFAIILLNSCSTLEKSTYKTPESKIIKGSNLIVTCESVVKDLVRNCTISVDKSKPIIVTSLVDINNLDKSSTMGRMAGELIANNLSQLGYIVKEMKMGQNKVFVREGQGEFILSRKLKEIAKTHEVQAVVVGTYALGEEVEVNQYGETAFNTPLTKLYISLRMIETNTNNIGCSASNSMIVGNTDIWE